MKIINVDCFALELSDGDGIGSTVEGYASHEDVAREWAKSKKGWGSYRKYSKKYVIMDSMDEINLIKKEKIIERALAKLTPEERFALGF